MAFNLTAEINARTNPANLSKVSREIQGALDKPKLNIEVKNAAKAQGEIKKLGTSLDKAALAADKLINKLSIKATDYAGYAIAAASIQKVTNAVIGATRESIKLQAELSKIAQVTSKVNSEVFAQSKAIKDISVEYNIASSKVAQLARTMAQTGLSIEKATQAAEKIAKTELLATFDSLQATTEGFIATMSSFRLGVDETAQSLEAINAVSKRFAVESSDIVEAIRRTGGAFSAAGGNVNELIALFTSVRSTSRESAETIATGFRTIFGRLQRPKTIEYFKELGIQLETAEGQFVGPLQAIKNISTGLDRLNISVGSTKFAEVVEQIGGIRQLSRVIPLLTQTEKVTAALGVANNGAAESAEDVAKAQATLAFQLGSLQKNFSAFIDEIVSSTALQSLASAFITIANAAIEVGRAAEPIVPLITAFAAVRGGSILAGGLGKLAGGGRGVIGLNSGGFVPGSGNRDTVPAMLTPGEFVIRKSAAEAFGAQNLHSINKYAKGGTVANDFGSRNLSKRVVRKADNLKGTLADSAIQFNDKDSFNSVINDAFYPSIIPNGFQGAGKRVSADQFERLVASRNEGQGKLASGSDKNAPLDFVGSKLIEVKRTKQRVSDAEVRDKTVRAMMQGQIGGASSVKLTGRKNTVNLPTVELANDSQKAMTQQDAKNIGLQRTTKVQTKNKGGSIAGSGTDTVPALLTPGEFVVNKKSAEAFGYGNLKQVNKYAKGGYVQKFQSGGAVSGLGLAAVGGLAFGGLGGFSEGLTSIVSSFTVLTLATSAFGGIATTAGDAMKKLKDGIDSLGETIKNNKQKREDLNTALEESKRKQAEAKTELSKATLNEAGASQTRAKFDPSGVDSIIAAQKPDLPEFEQKGVDLKAEKSKLRNRFKKISQEYKKDSEVTAALNKIKKDLKGKTQKQNAALDALTTNLNNSSKAAEVRLRAAKKNLKAINKETAAREQAANEAKKGGGVGGFIKGGLKKIGPEKLAKGLDAVATGALVFFSASLSQASKRAQEMADKAIEAGNITEARAKAEEAASKKQRAATQVQAAAAMSAVGTAVGGAIAGPIGAIVGGALGKLSALIPGVAQGFSDLTDWLGITNNAEQIKAARLKAANEALNKFAQATLKSTNTQIQLANQTGDTAAAEKVLSQGTGRLRKEIEGMSGLERNESTLGASDLGADQFLKQFTSRARVLRGSETGPQSQEAIFKQSEKLAESFENIKASLLLLGKFEELDVLQQKMDAAAQQAAINTTRFDELNPVLQGLKLATGEAVSSLDVFGKFINEEIQDRLKDQQSKLALFRKLEDQRIASSLKTIDVEEKIAKQRASLFGEEASPDQRRERQQRDRRRVSAVIGSRFGDQNLDQVTKSYKNSVDEVIRLQNEIQEASKEGSNLSKEKALELSKAFEEAKAKSDRLKQAQSILIDGQIANQQSIRAETQARLKAIGAIEDFKGALVEDFAFGTDEQRRDLGRSAALTSQAIRQGGIQNIASEDRGRVKSFLDRMPQNVKLGALGGRTAAQVKGQFAADEAVRKGLITADERDEFAKSVEQQQMPVEQRMGKAFEDGQKIINDTFDEQQKWEKEKIQSEKIATEKFAESVKAFEAAQAAAKAATPRRRNAAQEKELAGLIEKQKGLDLGKMKDEDIKLMEKFKKAQNEFLTKEKEAKSQAARNRAMAKTSDEMHGTLMARAQAEDKKASDFAARASSEQDKIDILQKGIDERRRDADRIKELNKLGPAAQGGGGAPQQNNVNIQGQQRVDVNLNGSAMNAVVSQVYTVIADKFMQLASDFANSNTPDEQRKAFENAAGGLGGNP